MNPDSGQSGLNTWNPLARLFESCLTSRVNIDRIEGELVMSFPS
jgi:hypothetical protein